MSLTFANWPVPLHMVPASVHFETGVGAEERIVATGVESVRSPVERKIGKFQHAKRTAARVRSRSVDVTRAHIGNAAVTSGYEDNLSTADGAQEIDGVLIKVDNFKFLQSVQGLLTGKVRLMYIDPPYNTGNTHYQYKDQYRREDWLAFIEERLSLSLPLLADNGSICVSIDDNEMPHLRLMLDRLLGENAFIACVAYERSGSAGLGQSSVILNTKEYILIYSKDKRALNDVGYERPLDSATMRRYAKVLLNEGEREVIETFEAGGNQAFLHRHHHFSISNISLRDFANRRNEIEMQYLLNFDKIFRTQNVQRENTFQNRIIARLQKDVLYSLDYIPSRGRYRGCSKTLYYWNAELCAWLKDSSSITGNTIIKRNKLTDFWSHGEIPKADLANEGGVLFSRSKKPEHLLYRLIAMTTKPGDLVVDYFLGSGTTTAVAHKMGRKWIGVENGEFFFDCPLKRMKTVVEGDPTGISRLVGWQGGGSFGYAEIDESA